MSVALVGMYPTTPIQTFPPPLPSGRIPLRDRCGVTMRLHLSTHGLGHAKGPSWPSPKGHVQPQRNNLPRRRNPRRIVFHDHEEDKVAVAAEFKQESAAVEQKVEEVVKVEEEPKADAFAPAPPVDEPCFQEFLPGLNITFIGSDDALDQLPGQSTSTPYTHIITMHFSDGAPIERLHEGRCQRLRLSLGARPAPGTRAGLGLSDAQLRSARDFIAEAQPHLHPEGMQNGVRVLIATPHGSPTNAMAVLACYLAFVTAKGVEDALLWIDQDEDFHGAWRGEVSEEEIERVEKIAQAWSWLSQVVRPGATA